MWEKETKFCLKLWIFTAVKRFKHTQNFNVTWFKILTKNWRIFWYPYLPIQSLLKAKRVWIIVEKRMLFWSLPKMYFEFLLFFLGQSGWVPSKVNFRNFYIFDTFTSEKKSTLFEDKHVKQHNTTSWKIPKRVLRKHNINSNIAQGNVVYERQLTALEGVG